MSSGNIHIHSMTGFANAAAECGSKRINLDLRAVNHRFLDIQIRMPDDLRYLESGIREKISSHIARGKVECKIQIQDAENGSQSLELNRDLVGQLAEINKDLRKHHDLAKLGVADILRFPGVLASQRENTEELAKSITELTEKALKDFTAARKREGKKLGEHLLQRLEAMEEIIDALSELFPTLLETHKEKSAPASSKRSAASTTTACNRNLPSLSKNPTSTKSSAAYAPTLPKCAVSLPNTKAAAANGWTS